MKDRFAKYAFALLAIFFLLEVSFRLMPYEWFAYRVWEIASRFPTTAGPFEPDRRFVKSDTLGDLGLRHWSPAFRRPKLVEFTTDHCGFRNPPDLYSKDSIEVLLLGDSYAVGSGISDDFAPRAQLSHALDVDVYSLAGSAISPRDIQKLFVERGVIPKLVVLYFIDFSFQWFRLDGTIGPCDGSLEVREERKRNYEVLQFFTLSRLQFFAQNLLSPLHNNVLQPAYFHRIGFSQTLRNSAVNDEMLFWRGHVERAVARSDEERLAVRLAAFAREIEKLGSKFVLVAIPSSYHVYFNNIVEPVYRIPRQTFLQRLVRQARENNVTVISIEQSLHTEANTRLQRGEYMYRRDDTHWNEEGISFVSKTLAKQLQPYLQEVPSSK